MLPEERDRRIKKMMEEDAELLTRKGADYSGTKDALKNFRRHGAKGLLVRIGDKYERLDTLLWNSREPLVDETLIDTLRDLRNYAYLLQLVLEEE
jgi:hypothetical protein